MTNASLERGDVSRGDAENAEGYGWKDVSEVVDHPFETIRQKRLPKVDEQSDTTIRSSLCSPFLCVLSASA